ncbi:glycoside hydrolase family 38 C-terminal domain-containing protein [Streptomyces sp. NBC_01262]|uniref:glycoside hydrolase family 38 N-terminal domain-containing protein n=1 Tax=Streptomyces sp. NBC_01262 TaxID=2903803 RepID=UPI002E350A47|nr:glycoside hydrolase family 38 C-terminal domain-containing protein [Streptomyces sp. NBC_01262]
MRIHAIRSTDLFVGTGRAPRQVVRVTVEGTADGAGRPAGPVRVRVEGPTVSTPEPGLITLPGPGEQTVAEVGVVISAPAPEGSVHRVTAIVEDADGVGAGRRCTADGTVTAQATGWTMWMVSHFHYDPVWWNTQAGFTAVRHELPDLPWVDRLRPPHVRSAFDLVRAHLDAARHDEDYRFVLAEIDYLKPHWDAYPDDRADLRRFLRSDRIELVGGSYNEPNTNLTHPESTIRNTVYGIGYQRDVLGGDPRSGWMLDVFGHDPAHPGLMADAGLDSSAWARGPFHNSGPMGHAQDIARMQFPSEFEWISPSGRGVLTHYMGAHYTAGWAINRAESADAAMEAAYGQYAELKKVAATRNVMLPVGHDHNVPSRWCTEVHREWAKRYVWPRFTMGLPRDFFDAVRREAEDRTAWTVSPVTPQTRDMNPVFTGKDVSYIDTKQAQRAAETAVLDGERLATLAATFLGERYPSEALDKAWRLLAYGAHHDAVTGTESDQVYIDLAAGWREAYELGDQVRGAALEQLAQGTDTRGEGRAVYVANTLSWERDGVVSVPAGEGLEIRDDSGRPVPAVADGGTLTFLARGIPSLGHRVHRLVESPAGGTTPGWTAVPGAAVIDNGTFRIEADPARGGALSRVTDLRTGRELLRPGGLGAELVVQDEHTTHPVWGEGPWHLLPKGPGRGTGAAPAASVRVEHSPVGRRIISEARLGELRFTQTATLWEGADRVDFRTRVDGSIGQDRLLRVRFDLDLPGALPVSEVGFAAIGRSFGFPDSDAAEHLWTLDNPAHTWAGLGSTAHLALRGPDGRTLKHAIGVAEVIAPADHDVRPLLAALVAQGVTATTTRPDGPRYGSLDADSNLPDIRFALGTDNAFAQAVLSDAGPAYREALATHGRVFVPATRTRREAWVPGADLRGPRDLPVLIAHDLTGLALTGSVIDVPVPDGLATTTEPADDYSAALLNHGTPSFVATADGTLCLTLMRACTDWPAGIWIDGERRTVPDGSSFALQHWTHDFRYSLVAGPGDWRAGGFVQAGQEANHPLLAVETAPSDGELPAAASLLTVEPDNVLLSALKPRGNAMASGLPGDADPGADGLAVRLYESQGRAVSARVRLFGAGLAEAEATDLLEQASDVRAVAVEDEGVVRVDLGAADVATFAARPVGAPRTPKASGAGRAEVAQPVFTRYWLHNAGPAPIGYLPVSVHLTQHAQGRIRVTVAAATRHAQGRVELDIPAGLTATPRQSLAYDLAPGEHADFELAVGPDEGAAQGTYYVAARIRDELGQLLEDAVPVTVGAPTAEPLRAELRQRCVRVTNNARSEIRGEVQLVSPYGTWGAPGDDIAVTPRTRGFAIAPGATAELPFAVGSSATAEPGGEWWVLAKVTAFGGVQYTRALPLTADGRCRSRG